VPGRAGPRPPRVGGPAHDVPSPDQEIAATAALTLLSTESGTCA
jgi:hypothetical protein